MYVTVQDEGFPLVDMYVVTQEKENVTYRIIGALHYTKGKSVLYAQYNDKNGSVINTSICGNKGMSSAGGM